MQMIWGSDCNIFICCQKTAISLESLEFLIGPGVVPGLPHHLHLLCHRGGVLQLGHEGLYIENHRVPGPGSPPSLHHVQGAGDDILPPSPAVTAHLSYKPSSPEAPCSPDQKKTPGPTYCSPKLEITQPQLHGVQLQICHHSGRLLAV